MGAITRISERTGVSGGLLCIALLGVVSALVLAVTPKNLRPDFLMWVSHAEHRDIYEPVVERWSAEEAVRAEILQLDASVLAQRLLAASFAGASSADLTEMHDEIVGQVFRGPVEGVPLMPLDDLIERDGLSRMIPDAAFSTWRTRGVTFGVPHDVHPVVLLYHKDIVDRAGIDVEAIETWDDFAEAVRPILEIDDDNDGRPDHYPISLWESNARAIELLMLQAGGGLFDQDLQPTLATDVNARVLATIASWTSGDGRIAVEVPLFTETGYVRTARGDAVFYLAPDWLAGMWQSQIPALKGKLRGIKLPAWEEGGRRTSVWGGTMAGIPKTSRDPERAWSLIKRLYLSEEVAQRTYETAGIISPVRERWSSSYYHEPNNFFGGQPIGSLYVGLAEEIPPRVCSPFGMFARGRLQDAAYALKRVSEANPSYTPEDLEPYALELLEEAERRVIAQMERNAFAPTSGGAE